MANKSNLALDNLNETGQAKFDEKASVDLSNLSTVGQAILDKKVEVEALLEQNGYAKFTWKDGNNFSILLMCWSADSTSNKTTTLPIAYTKSYAIIGVLIGIENIGANYFSEKTLSSFTVASHTRNTDSMGYLTIGT